MVTDLLGSCAQVSRSIPYVLVYTMHVCINVIPCIIEYFSCLYMINSLETDISIDDYSMQCICQMQQVFWDKYGTPALYMSQTLS